jgi:hypothetical protein
MKWLLKIMNIMFLKTVNIDAHLRLKTLSFIIFLLIQLKLWRCDFD